MAEKILLNSDEVEKILKKLEKGRAKWKRLTCGDLLSAWMFLDPTSFVATRKGKKFYLFGSKAGLCGFYGSWKYYLLVIDGENEFEGRDFGGMTERKFKKLEITDNLETEESSDGLDTEEDRNGERTQQKQKRSKRQEDKFRQKLLRGI